MSYRAVLFDLDGTLLDTIEDLANSMNSVLAGLGFPIHDVEAYKRFVGDGMEVLVHRALPEGCRDQETLAKSVGAMREEYGRRWAERTRPYDGIPELLDALMARGIRMAVLSNKPDDFTKMTISKMLSRWEFELVLGVRPGGAKKPDPQGALEIAEQLGIPPREFLYLGDTNTDMRTAVAAGMYPVGALWGFRTAEELSGSGARLLIERPMDLLGLL
jgi:phosphoglycolate phosphatase